jgi:hypothetical protein
MASPLATGNEEILALAHRLIHEYAEVPAGVVLASLTRAGRRARAWGCPPEHLAATIEASTRWRLAQGPWDPMSTTHLLPRP